MSSDANILLLSNLNAALKRYPSGDATEELHRQHLLSALESGLTTDRNIMEPGHLVVSAVARNAATGRIALIFHGKLNRWLQPGGHIESSDESLNAAAARELKEETGIVVAAEELHLVDVDIHLIPETQKEVAHLHFDLRFACRVATEALIAESDAQEVKWFSDSELSFADADPSLSRLFAKIFMG